MKKREKSFVRGAFILIFFGILSKILGAIYRIPLTGIITPEGMGLYQMVFPVYSLMLTISSSGLPSSISKLIAEANAKNQYKQAEKIMKVSFVLLFCFSVLCSLVLVFGSCGFALVQGNKSATICYFGLAPAVVFVGFLAGFRGYFQGLEKMLPSAISGFVEQLFKLCFGLLLARILLPKGVEYAVLGAMLGISISELFAFVFMLVYYVVFRRKRKQGQVQDFTILSTKETSKQILHTSIFVTLGGLIVPLGMMIDSALVINILKRTSFSTKEATTLFGLESGTVGSIVNMPVILSLALATAVLPCVSSKKASGDLEGAKKSASKALLLSFLIALPASFGCFALAEPIMKILYGRSLSAVEIETASQILEIASASIFFLAMVQVSAGILQGISKPSVPAISLSVGLAVKTLLNIVLISQESINIFGTEIANAVCYLTAFLINLFVIEKNGFVQISPRVFASLCASSLVFLAKPIFSVMIGLNLNYYLAFLVCVIAVVLAYFALVFLLYRKELKKL